MKMGLSLNSRNIGSCGVQYIENELAKHTMWDSSLCFIYIKSLQILRRF